LFGILLSLIFLMAAIWGGHDLYVRWQEKAVGAPAMVDIEHGNERDASLAARSIFGNETVERAAQPELWRSWPTRGRTFCVGLEARVVQLIHIQSTTRWH